MRRGSHGLWGLGFFATLAWMPTEPKPPRWPVIACVGFVLVGVGLGMAATATSWPLVAPRMLLGAWVLVFLVAFASALAALPNDERRSRALGVSLLPLLVGSAGVGPGTVMLVNRFGSEAAQRSEQRHVVVLSHRTHTAKGQTTYYVSVAPVPPLEEPLEL